MSSGRGGGGEFPVWWAEEEPGNCHFDKLYNNIYSYHPVYSLLKHVFSELKQSFFPPCNSNLCSLSSSIVCLEGDMNATVIFNSGGCIQEEGFLCGGGRDGGVEGDLEAAVEL